MFSQQSQSEQRRMDLALKEAATLFSGNATQNKLIVLMTSGNQFSGEDGRKDDQKLLFIQPLGTLLQKH